MAEAALRMERDLWEASGVVEAAVVADLGCGPGAISVVLARLVGPAGPVVAVDRDPDVVQTARAAATRAGLDNVSVDVGNGQDTGIAPASVDPDDLTNEVFVGVLTRIGSFSGNEDQFRSWVFTIAHSRLVDERRRVDRRPALGDQEPETWADVAGGDAEDEALRRLGDERVRSLCQQLVPDQRDVLVLRLMVGLSIEAIAGALGKSEGAVKSLQHRGLANLRKILEREAVSL